LYARGNDKYENIQCNEKNFKLNSHLWKIGDENPSYMFGSLHVPYTQIWRYINENVKQAFHSTFNTYAELDMTPSIKITFRNCQYSSSNRQSELEKENHKKIYKILHNLLQYIKNYKLAKFECTDRIKFIHNNLKYQCHDENANSNDYTYMEFCSLKNIWISIYINQILECFKDMKQFHRRKRTIFYKTKKIQDNLMILDEYLIFESKLSNKRVGQLETIQEQCDMFDKIDQFIGKELLDMALTKLENVHDKIKKQPKLINSIRNLQQSSVKKYVCGNFTLDVLPLSFPEINKQNYSIKKQKKKIFTNTYNLNKNNVQSTLYKLFFQDRNFKISKRIFEILNSNYQFFSTKPRNFNKSNFFIIGSGHLIGENSIPYILRNKYNLSVKLVPSNENIIGSRQNHPSFLADIMKNIRIPLNTNLNKKKIPLDKGNASQKYVPVKIDQNLKSHVHFIQIQNSTKNISINTQKSNKTGQHKESKHIDLNNQNLRGNFTSSCQKLIHHLLIYIIIVVLY
ncbi:Metalloprotease TIKI2, partial [Intoshia linei]